MRREGPPGHPAKPELPADDLPSADVLDELLRAFSADAADEETLGRIDLASPEVAELLAPTAPTPAPAEPRPPLEGEPQVEIEGVAASAEGRESPPEVEDEGADDVAAVPVADAGAEGAAAPVPPDLNVAQPAVQPTGDVVPDDEVLPTTSVPGEPLGPEPSAAPPAVDAEDSSSSSTRTVVIDASDDPPDAVYLAAGDPLLNASAAARGLATARTEPAPPADTTVFIDDQAVEAGETISMADASSATRIEPRLRERRIAVKRAVGRRRLRWAFVALGVLVVVVAALAVLGSSLFAIDDVRVDGAVHTDAARLQEVVDELQGTPVLRADTDRAERELESIPWVAAARVTTQFPHGATIELRERQAVASYRGSDDRFRLIDIDGRVLEVLATPPVDYLPIDSPDIVDLEPGQFTAQGFIAAANLVKALTPEARALAAGVTVTGNGGDLRMTLTDGREVRFGPGRDLVVKLVRLQTKLQELDAPGFQYLDVSTDDVTTG